MVEEIRYPIVVDHAGGMIYEDDRSVKSEYLQVKTLEPLMDLRKWTRLNRKGKDEAAAAIDSDLSQVFFGRLLDPANRMFNKLADAAQKRDQDYAAAIITSQDFKELQNTLIIGEQSTTERTGILGRPFEEITLDTLSGKWLDITEGVEYITNVPEGKSVEPTKGEATTIEVEVGKHEGAVGITERAQNLITGRPIFSRSVTALGNARLKSENKMVADELETATTTLAGVDVGLKAGVPLSSSNDPQPMTQSITDALDDNGGWDTAISKSQFFNEYISNDMIKGINSVPPNPTGTEQTGPLPGVTGVTIYRDNAIASATKFWALNASRALKLFRSFTRAFQVVELKEERTTQYLKSHFQPRIVDQDAIIEVTGVTA